MEIHSEIRSNLNIMSRIIRILFLFLILILVYFGIQYQAHGEIVFHTDIARDFIVMRDMQLDGITLVGPRADWKGLFHGPLWFYVNYPAFVIGNGNPVAVGWFWVFASIIFPILYYVLFKKIIGEGGAFIFALLTITTLMNYVQEFYNPIGATILIPFLVYCAYQYVTTKKIQHSVLLFFLCGLVTQFQLAIGIPMTFLSGLLLLYEVVKSKKYTHLLSPFIILVPLSTFIVFELRHGFLQTNAVIHRFTTEIQQYVPSLFERFRNRFKTLTIAGLGFFPLKIDEFNTSIFLYAMFLFGTQFAKKKKQLLIFTLITLYYGGFYLFSFVQKGHVLNHEYISLFFLPILFFSALYEHANKKLFSLVVVVILIVNILILQDRAERVTAFSQTSHSSWKFQLELGKTIYENANTNDVGVFVYAPDIYAYAPKYASAFAAGLYPDKTFHFNQKRDETFLVYEPPPEGEPHLNGTYFREGQIGLIRQPDEVYELFDGYRVEKYLLTEEEKSVPHDPIIDDWVTQR